MGKALKIVRAYFRLARSIWHAGTRTSRGVLRAAQENIMGKDENDISDLILPSRDPVIIDLYKEAAKVEGVGLRTFLISYNIGRVRGDK